MQRNNQILEPYYTIPKRSDFLDSSFKLKLTEESKKLFDLGVPGQGYIGVLDLEDGLITLMPAFNKNDGCIPYDKNGNKLKSYLMSLTELGGGLGGDLHKQASGRANNAYKFGTGQLMGFGLWKSGCRVRITSTPPKADGRIPNEYILLKEKNGYELYYVDAKFFNLNAVPVEDVPGLSKLLDDLQDKPPESLSNNERSAINECILDNHRKKNHDGPEDHIKLVKNRSTQNTTSLKYDPMYLSFFRNALADHQSHALNVRRELPAEVFKKILQSVYKGLDLPLISSNAEFNSILPHLGNDDIAAHLDVEQKWINSTNYKNYCLTLKELEHANLLSTDLENDKNIRMMEPLFRNKDINPDLGNALSVLNYTGKLNQEIFESLCKSATLTSGIVSLSQNSAISLKEIFDLPWKDGAKILEFLSLLESKHHVKIDQAMVDYARENSNLIDHLTFSLYVSNPANVSVSSLRAMVANPYTLLNEVQVYSTEKLIALFVAVREANYNLPISIRITDLKNTVEYRYDVESGKWIYIDLDGKQHINRRDYYLAIMTKSALQTNERSDMPAIVSICYQPQVKEADDLRNFRVTLQQNNNFQISKRNEEKTNPYISNQSNNSWLHMACTTGDVALVSRVIENSNIKDLDFPNNDGLTPLHLAIKYGQEDMAIFLINRGANVNINIESNTLYSMNGVPLKEVEKLLFLRQRKQAIEAMDKDNNTNAKFSLQEDQQLYNLINLNFEKLNAIPELKHADNHNIFKEIDDIIKTAREEFRSGVPSDTIQENLQTNLQRLSGKIRETANKSGLGLFSDLTNQETLANKIENVISSTVPKNEDVPKSKYTAS